MDPIREATALVPLAADEAEGCGGGWSLAPLSGMEILWLAGLVDATCFYPVALDRSLNV